MRTRETDRRRLRWVAWGLVAALLFLAPAKRAAAGAYTFAGELYGVDIVTHPKGYTGAGGVINVSVCIDPTSVNASAMEIPVQNIINTWNSLNPVTGNLLLGGSNDIPSGALDFESVALHELGHCIGLAHPNAASESGLSGNDMNYTKATDGANDVFDIDDGADNVIGSNDDVRGDDVNLHWFRKSDNNPFTMATTVDSTTYSRDLSDLPTGHLFATNGDRHVSTLLGVPNTEAVMQQGTYFDEDQRRLTHDDAATIRYAMSGLNETEGTADDYSVVLSYAGLTTACDAVMDFDNAQTGLASCSVGGSFINSTHVRITSAQLFFNSGFTWHFNTQLNFPPDDFESGFGNWSNIATGDDFDWTRDSGGTPSSGTGPSGDHTTGSGYYLFIETSSPRAAGDTAILESPCVDLTGVSEANLNLWYHMYGASIGTLDVQVASSTGGSCGALGSYASAFSLSGNQGNAWYEANVDLDAYAGGSIHIKILGIRGSSSTGDIAIDDITLPGTAAAPVCGNTVKESGEDCDDGNTDPGDCCSATCQYEVAGSSCDDADVCNGLETCDGAGTCDAGTPLNCDDGNVCTNDSCIPATGCDYAYNTDPCPDGDLCNGDEVCDGAGTCGGGTALNCDDGNVCTNDSCIPATGCDYAYNTNPCPDDGLYCTVTNTCVAGACVGAGDPCPADADGDCSDCCNEAADDCTLACLDGSACTDDLFCSATDTCSAGVCVGAGDPCPPGEVCGEPDMCLEDSDSDGIADAADNCKLVPNGPLAGPTGCYTDVQTDTDGDGYGDPCDGDFSHDGAVNSTDELILNPDLGTGTSTPGTGTDMNCDGTVNSSDVMLFNSQIAQGFPGP